MIPSEEAQYNMQQQTVRTKFDKLRAVIDVLEAAVLEQADMCHAENMGKLTAEVEKCTAFEAELEAELNITKEFVWSEGEEGKAPPKVARADMRLVEMSELAMD